MSAIHRPLLQSGFRPFFLLGTLYAAVSLCAWLLLFVGVGSLPVAWPAVHWHGHEMLFGFVTTAMAGFLLTAVPTWTDTSRIGGRPLALLVVVWGLGRVALWLVAVLPGALVAALDLLFLPLLAGAIGRPIFRSGKRRNYPVVAILLLLAVANLALHWSVLTGTPAASRRSLLAALYLVVVLLTIISGRIVPLFTRNALRNRGVTESVVSSLAVERALVLVMGASITMTLVAEGTRVSAFASIACGLLLGVRQAQWQPHRTVGLPIVWILHVGHGWLAIGFVCAGVAVLAPSFPASSALHALSAGAIGTFIVGVMTRVALGHTGREVKASPAMVAAYVLVIVGGAIRVFGPLLLPLSYRSTVLWGGASWAAGYLLAALCCATILTRPRADGRPG